MARLLLGGSAPGIGLSLLRSDLIRKRLHGVAPNERLDANAYSTCRSAEVYRKLERRARDLLEAGRTVIADATFLDQAARTRIEQTARDLEVPFHGIWLDAPRSILAERIAARRDDASDATIDVLAQQAEREIGPLTWTVIDAGNDAAQVAGDIQQQLPN